MIVTIIQNVFVFFRPVVVGGVAELRPINDDDMKVWNKVAIKLHLCQSPYRFMLFRSF